MTYFSFIKKISGCLMSSAGLPPDKEPILVYALEVIVTSLVNIISTITLGKLLGVLPGTIACLATVFFFRHTAGGAHSKSPWRCAVITITVFPLLALLASYLSTRQPIRDILSIVSIIIGLVAVIRLAPVESKNAPIISSTRRKILKLSSLLILVLVALTILILRWIIWIYASEIQVCVVLGILWVSIMLSSFGHRLLLFIDGVVIPKGKGV